MVLHFTGQQPPRSTLDDNCVCVCVCLLFRLCEENEKLLDAGVEVKSELEDVKLVGCSGCLRVCEV